MDWRFVAKMGLLGLVPGVLRLYGWIPGGREFPVWLALGIVWIAFAARQARQAAFQHVFMASVIAGLLSMVPAVFFLGTYVANNPLPVNATSNTTVDPVTEVGRGALLAAGVVWGTLFGILSGAIATLAVRLTRKDEEKDRTAPQGMRPLGAPMDITHPERDDTATGKVAVDDESEE